MGSKDKDPNEWMGPKDADPEDYAGPRDAQPSDYDGLSDDPHWEDPGIEPGLLLSGKEASRVLGKISRAMGVGLEGRGCAGVLILGILMTLALAFLALQWLSSDTQGTLPISDESPSPDAAATPLVPIDGEWEFENFAFVEGCGPGDLGSGVGRGTLDVRDGGAVIQYTPSNPAPGETALLLQRVESSAQHASYLTTGGVVTIEVRFLSPQAAEAVVYFDGPDGSPELCVIRPVEGYLIAAASSGSGEGQGSPPGAPETPGDDDPDDPGSPEDDGQVPANVSIPQPGETRLDLGEESFTFSGGSDCTITDDTFAISGLTTVSGDNQIDIAINGNRIGDQWAIGISATSSTSGITMSSLGDAVGTPVIDGSVLYIEAEFVRVLNEDFENAEPMGTGTIVCNCG